jgi:hypothetical protein
MLSSSVVSELFPAGPGIFVGARLLDIDPHLLETCHPLVDSLQYLRILQLEVRAGSFRRLPTPMANAVETRLNDTNAATSLLSL